MFANLSEIGSHGHNTLCLHTVFLEQGSLPLSENLYIHSRYVLSAWKYVWLVNIPFKFLQ